MTINDLHYDDLLEEVKSAKASGKTLKQLSEKLGITYEGLRSRIKRANKKKREEQSFTNTTITIEEENNKSKLVAEIPKRDYDRIKTLEQLIQYCQIDLEIWKIDKHVVNKWEVGSKDKDGNIIVEPLFQVKCWLSKRKPEPVVLVVKPVSIVLDKVPSTPPHRGGVKKALVIPDIQAGFKRNLSTGSLVPFHDRMALDVCLQIAQNNKFDKVVYLGDLIDLAIWSDKFIRSPEFYFTTQPAIQELAWWIGQIKLATGNKCETVCIEGNHDLRLEKHISIHLSEAYQLRAANEMNMPSSMSIERLLGLSTLKVKWVGGYPESRYYINDDLFCEHGRFANNAPGATARTMIDKVHHNVIFGHIHRIERATKTICDNGKQRTVTAYSPGCLCRLDYIVPGHTRYQNWQQGIAIVDYTKDYNKIEVVPIQNGFAIYNNTPYRAVDRTKQIRNDINNEFI